MIREKHLKALWFLETNLLIRVSIEELGGGYADLASGISEIATRTCENQKVGYGSCHTQWVRGLVLADRCDSCRPLCTLGICGEHHLNIIVRRGEDALKRRT